MNGIHSRLPAGNQALVVVLRVDVNAALRKRVGSNVGCKSPEKLFCTFGAGELEQGWEIGSGKKSRRAQRTAIFRGYDARFRFFKNAEQCVKSSRGNEWLIAHSQDSAFHTRSMGLQRPDARLNGRRHAFRPVGVEYEPAGQAFQFLPDQLRIGARHHNHLRHRFQRCLGNVPDQAFAPVLKHLLRFAKPG